MTKALIIGAGPSLQANLDKLKEMDKFDGVVLCTDGAINKVLENGIIPDYVGTLEDTPDLDKYYITDLVKEKGHLLKGAYISDRVHNNTRKAIRDAGLGDPLVAADLRGYITSNVGLFFWLLATISLKCDEIFMIGMDHCYGTNEFPNVERDSDIFRYGFKTRINPYNEEEIILHPAFELWTEEFEWYVKKYEKVRTINLTGRGSLYSRDFIWHPITKLKDWNGIF